jgi:phosphoglycerate-specific signal transduction histidine kinase
MSAGMNSSEGDSGLPKLLEELRQPLAAATNYIGAARLLIGPVGHESCARALEHLSQAEQQLLRAGGIIGKIRDAKQGSPNRP